MNRTPLSPKNKGATLAEYGILVGLISVGAIGAVLSFGNTNKESFEIVERSLSSEVLNRGGNQGDDSSEENAPFDWMAASSYPDNSECTSVPENFNYDAVDDPAQDCYVFASNAGGAYDLSGASQRHIYKISGPIPFDEVFIDPSAGGSDTLLDTTPGSGVDVPAYATQGPGVYNMHMVNQSCGTATITKSEFMAGPDLVLNYDIEFTDGTLLTSYNNSLDNLYCAADDVLLTQADIMAAGEP